MGVSPSIVFAVTGLIPVIVKAIVDIVQLFKSGQVEQNPVMEAVDENIKRVEEAARKAAEDARKAAEKGERSQRAKEKAELERQRAEDVVQAEVEKAKEAERQVSRARAEQQGAEERARKAEKMAKDAAAAHEKATRDLKMGVRPVEWPTRVDFERMRKSRQYTEGFIHFAIAGVSGTGKSSLINAFRGLANRDPGAAKTGIVETTSEVTRYRDPDVDRPFVWYDIPGAGTLVHQDWQYFNDKGLYIFDCIIVLFDNRFTSIDIAILKNCARWNIPSYIVRSKSDQHINNVMKGLADYDSDDDDTDGDVGGHRETLVAEARAEYVRQTNESVQENLKRAGLPTQKIYCISKDGLLSLINPKPAKRNSTRTNTIMILDEALLLKDVLSEIRTRRMKPDTLN
jgi:GTP-binding protein EngB required for normal cell division